jgi:CheY-like chemotaxis protein
VLLAEDHPVNRQLATAMLGREGHSVTAARNGAEAVDLYRNGSFDVVLMDVQMPEMDGLEAAATIRRLEQQTRTHVPIIAMTAHAMQEYQDKCRDAGMDGYVSKPVRIADLMELIGALTETEPDASLCRRPKDVIA